MADVGRGCVWPWLDVEIVEHVYIYVEEVLLRSGPSNTQTTLYKITPAKYIRHTPNHNNLHHKNFTNNTKVTHHFTTYMFRSKSPAKTPASPRPTAQQNTNLLRALFLEEEERRSPGPYTRRPSTSTPSQSEPRRSQETEPRRSQDGTLHVIGEKEGTLRSGSNKSDLQQPST